MSKAKSIIIIILLIVAFCTPKVIYKISTDNWIQDNLYNITYIYKGIKYDYEDLSVLFNGDKEAYLYNINKSKYEVYVDNFIPHRKRIGRSIKHTDYYTIKIS